MGSKRVAQHMWGDLFLNSSLISVTLQNLPKALTAQASAMVIQKDRSLKTFLPQLLFFIAGGLADVKDEDSYYMRVEQEAADKPLQDTTILESLQKFYYGEEPASSR
jgi:hypothetical protein